MAARLTQALIGFSALFIAVSPAWGGGLILEVVPSTSMVMPGDPLSVDVVISGLGSAAAPSLGTFDLTLTFDPALFSFTGVSFGLELGDELAAEAITSSTLMAGDLEVVELSLLTPAVLNAGQPSSFTLVSASFSTLAVGSGSFDLSSPILGDENGAPLGPPSVVPAVVDSAGVLDIPAAGTWGLVLLAGLLLAFGWQRLREVSR